MRADCTPIIIDGESGYTPLTRITFDSKSFAESFLQEAIANYPHILPVDKFAGGHSPLVSLGREIFNIDNLLISPTGKISVIETKLWRNPQATREVIAQIIDYANTLWGMDYEDFERQCRTALPPSPLKDKSIYELVQKAYPHQSLDEGAFHDSVQKCLTNAEFLLLIVGDGIRENLEGMADFLHQPQMQFRFGLVELQVYDIADLGRRLIVPNIVAHSTTLKRTIVTIHGGATATVSVNIDEPPTPTKTRRILTEAEFFDELKEPEAAPLFRELIEFGEELGAHQLWRASSVGLRLPDPHGIKKHGYTLYLLNLDATVSDAFLGYQLNDAFKDTSIADERGIALSEIHGIPYSHKYHGLERSIPWRSVQKHLEDFKTLMRDTVIKINALDASRQ